LQRGHCYRSSAGLVLAGAEPIKIESIGPRYVGYRQWEPRSDVRPIAGWSPRHRHPRVLFDSWDGTWHEVEPPA